MSFLCVFVQRILLSIGKYESQISTDSDRTTAEGPAGSDIQSGFILCKGTWHLQLTTVQSALSTNKW